ncbi:hypothetical protein [Streptomyces brasiliensis]|uniref:hypothetical protein n=1 Tax=Streptomyces brasiliensis TaxID=1954 RepID=UPI00166F7197|nr:hypothetical protein [Streptomyces brasiliensis]
MPVTAVFQLRTNPSASWRNPERSRFQLVDDHRDAFEVKRYCEVLGLNRSSYHK